MTTESLSNHHDQSGTDNLLHDRADDFVSGMDRTERVAWLKSQGFADRQIFDVLLGEDDPELDEFCRDTAHGIAADAVNGARSELPEWLN
jgi:hypothetical protein